jgi:precorrin-2/cobalt-factor-2 C20-methyltransferase
VLGRITQDKKEKAVNGKGILYGVSVGPGDPELMTVKSVKCIEACDVIAAPQTKSGEMLALSIAEQTVDMKDKLIVPLLFEMSRDPEKMHATHVKDADAIEKYLAEGKDVAMLNLGDVSVYGTFCYMMEILEERGYECRMIAGVTSFCAISSTLGISLTELNDPLIIVPGHVAEEVLDMRGVKVIMKSYRDLPEVIGQLKERGMLETSQMVCNCGLSDQKIYRNLAEFDPEKDRIEYFATIVAKND